MEIVDGYKEPPVPYDEDKLPSKPWKVDPWDDVLPSDPGFLTDVVLALRGTSIPTAFALWTAILVIATAVKREAWMKWYPKPLYGNLYLMLVSPPRLNKKSSCISFGERLLRKFPAYIRDYLSHLRFDVNRIGEHICVTKLLKPSSFDYLHLIRDKSFQLFPI